MRQYKMNITIYKNNLKLIMYNCCCLLHFRYTDLNYSIYNILWIIER